ncbi:MAG: hypothetical protein IPH53_13885 [Flavobacteriales bacterium]|nr:hypothetical protein [Flavobacteriales bacterium]
MIPEGRGYGIRTILDADFDYQGHGDLRLGPDGRIYVAHQIEGFVDVIEYPDLPGAACGFTPAGFALRSTIGLVPRPTEQRTALHDAPCLGNDTTFSCATEPFHLFVPTTINGSFSWQDGSTGPTFLVDTSGTYSEVISLCGSAIDTLLVLSGDDEVDVDPWSGILPNVFTPNNDGENETFPLLPVPMEKMSITINDRWGAGLDGCGREEGSVSSVRSLQHMSRDRPIQGRHCSSCFGVTSKGTDA